MSSTQMTAEVFEREFLNLRAKALEIAAALDRIDRAEGGLGSDPRRQQIAAALETLLREDPDRAEQIQLIFSRPYNDEWEQQFDITRFPR